MKVIDLINTMKDEETISVKGIIYGKDGIEGCSVWTKRKAKDLKDMSKTVNPTFFEKTFNAEVSTASVYDSTQADLVIYTMIDVDSL